MQSSNPFGFVTLSTLIHSSVVLGLMMVPHLEPLADGGGGSTIVEFESTSSGGVPEIQTAALDQAATEPPMTSPEPVAKVETVLPPKEVPETVKAAPAVKKTAKRAEKKAVVEKKPLKFKNTTAIKELPPKETVEEDLAEENVIDEPVSDDGVTPALYTPNQKATDEIWSKEDVAAADAEASEYASSDDNGEDDETTEGAVNPTGLEAESSESAESQSLAPAQLAQTRPGSSSGSRAHGTDPSAPPSGPIRSYEDLRQVPGNKPPQYPHPARLQRQQGQIVLRYFVTGDGRVSNMTLMKSSGYPMLDQEAIASVGRYKYVPGQEGWTLHPVNFNLKGPEEGAGGRLRTSRR